jgi:hypothetical protein
VTLLVKTKVLESYIIHADPDAVPGFLVRNFLIDIGRIERLIKIWIKNELDHDIISEAESIFETLPDLEFFEQLPRESSADFFFEGLVSVVKTSVLSLQAGIYKEKNNLLDNLKSELLNLKQNYDANFHGIVALEDRLAQLTEQSLRDDLENYKIFDRLNNEKLTPYFMKLAKAQNSSPDITIIRGDLGEELDTQQLNEHVTSTYEKIYTEPPGNLNIRQDDILEFLGQVQHLDPVINSKLTQRENEDLDRPLTLLEFDKAIKQCNKKSAPGTDGINNKFIAHFWHYFRKPLLDYMNCCYEKGKLTALFRTAKIRLIPKKGDLTKNW